MLTSSAAHDLRKDERVAGSSVFSSYVNGQVDGASHAQSSALDLSDREEAVL